MNALLACSNGYLLYDPTLYGLGKLSLPNVPSYESVSIGLVTGPDHCVTGLQLSHDTRLCVTEWEPVRSVSRAISTQMIRGLPATSYAGTQKARRGLPQG